MDKELIIKSGTVGVEIALLEDKKLVEFNTEDADSQYKVGDIFLGQIKKINPGLNAAFVDVGHDRDAFLHYTDLSPNIRSLVKFTNLAIQGNRQFRHLENFKFEPEIVKTGKITNALNRKYPVLVQILKEPISTKGPRLTCEITLAGRYLIMAPFGNSIGVSKRIGSYDERKRLIRLIESIRPKNFSVVIRTAAEGKGVADLHDDLKALIEKWDQMVDRLKDKRPPAKILSEMDRTSGLLRDLLSKSFTRIVTDDKLLANDLKKYVAKISPGKENIVQFHQGRNSVFDANGVTKQIKSSFGKSVTMDSGAYIVIEHTEALHVVDVNSGYKSGSKGDQENNALAVNLEAAKEIARQLRLRDIGGIIIIDFIDMKSPANKKQVYNVMKDAMEEDRARHTVLPVSKFGLLQITRQRVRPEIKISTAEVCPTCNGTGKIGPSLLIVDEIERDLDYLMKTPSPQKLKLAVHPFIEAYLKRGLRSTQRDWFGKYKKWIKIVSDNSYQMVEFHFFAKDDEEISLERAEGKGTAAKANA